MTLNISNTIDDNIITVDIAVASLGTTTTTETEEAQIITDFPRSIRFSDIDFKANMKIDSTSGDPVITTDATDDSTIVEVKIENLVNKEYALTSDLHIVTTFDVTKIPASALNTVFDSAEKLGKAYAVLFANKIQGEISKKLTELRALNTKFEGETEVIL